MFSIRTLLAFCAIVAFASWTIANASHRLSSLVSTATFIILLATLVGVVYREGGSRAFCVGAAIFGWGYMFLAYSNLLNVKGHLLTAELMGDLFQYMHPGGEVFNPGTGTVADPSIDTFWQLGHSFSALALAFVGGIVARYLYATRDAAT